jgi:hypothetical protein
MGSGSSSPWAQATPGLRAPRSASGNRGTSDSVVALGGGEPRRYRRRIEQVSRRRSATRQAGGVGCGRRAKGRTLQSAAVCPTVLGCTEIGEDPERRKAGKRKAESRKMEGFGLSKMESRSRTAVAPVGRGGLALAAPSPGPPGVDRDRLFRRRDGPGWTYGAGNARPSAPSASSAVKISP